VALQTCKQLRSLSLSILNDFVYDDCGDDIARLVEVRERAASSSEAAVRPGLVHARGAVPGRSGPGQLRHRVHQGAGRRHRGDATPAHAPSRRLSQRRSARRARARSRFCRIAWTIAATARSTLTTSGRCSRASRCALSSPPTTAASHRALTCAGVCARVGTAEQPAVLREARRTAAHGVPRSACHRDHGWSSAHSPAHACARDGVSRRAQTSRTIRWLHLLNARLGVDVARAVARALKDHAKLQVRSRGGSSSASCLTGQPRHRSRQPCTAWYSADRWSLSEGARGATESPTWPTRSRSAPAN
jgi:hypothetical protein